MTLALAGGDRLHWHLQLSTGVVALTLLLALILAYLSRPLAAADDKARTNVMPTL